MGHKSSDLIPFLKEALSKDKYVNLKPAENATNTFKLHLPRMTPILGKNCQHILKDWENLRKRQYIYCKDYSSAKRRMKTGIETSVFCTLLRSSQDEFYFRFLEFEEIKEKKQRKKDKAKLKLPKKTGNGKDKLPRKTENKDDDFSNTMDYSPSYSSGYSSGEGSPVNSDVNKKDDYTILIQLDHNYIVKGHEGAQPPVAKVNVPYKNAVDSLLGGNEASPLTIETLFSRKDEDPFGEREGLKGKGNENRKMGNEWPNFGNKHNDFEKDLFKMDELVFQYTKNWDEIMPFWPFWESAIDDEIAIDLFSEGMKRLCPGNEVEN